MNLRSSSRKKKKVSDDDQKESDGRAETPGFEIPATPVVQELSKPLQQEFLVVKKWRGSLRYILGYSGPPGTKYSKTICQEHRLIRSTAELDDMCGSLVNYYYSRVRGPAGRVSYTPELQKWRDSIDESMWKDHMVVVVVHHNRHPKVEAIFMNNTSSSSSSGTATLKVQYSAERRTGQMETQHGLFMAVQVACDPSVISCGGDEDVCVEFECVSGSADVSDDEDEEEEDEEEEDEDEEEDR
jgi:hypothetical protein